MTEEKKKFNFRVQHWILIAAVIVAFLGVFLLIKPYVNSIILAFILSLLCLPFHQKIEQRLGNKPNTAGHPLLYFTDGDYPHSIRIYCCCNYRSGQCLFQSGI